MKEIYEKEKTYKEFMNENSNHFHGKIKEENRITQELEKEEEGVRLLKG